LTAFGSRDDDDEAAGICVDGSAALGRGLGQADQDVETQMFLAQVFDLLAFDEPDAAVALGEVMAVLGDPRCGYQDSRRGVLVVHDPGQGAHRLDAHRTAIALGLDDAVAAHEGIFVDGHRTSASTNRALRTSSRISSVDCDELSARPDWLSAGSGLSAG
jgi:hypothetical protein